MRDMFRYFFRGREGLLSYLAYMGAALSGLFILHMIMLIVLVSDDYFDYIELMFYEVFGSGFAAIFFGVMIDRLLRISVNGGTSRKSFIYTVGAAAPLFALISAAAIELVYIITDLIYELFGMGLACAAFSDVSSNTRYYFHNEGITFKYIYIHPKVVFMNIIILFFIIMVFYSFSLLFVGFKNRIRTLGAAIVTGAVAFVYQISADNYVGLLGYIYDCFEDYLFHSDIIVFDVGEFWTEGIQLTYSGMAAFMLEYGFLLFAALYIVFVLLTIRVPMRGKV